MSSGGGLSNPSNRALYLQPNGGGVSIGTAPATGYQLTVNSGTYSAQGVAAYAAVQGVHNATSGSGYGGYFSAATTGSGYGVYGASTGTPNTGYAGYFTNADTASVSYGIYASASSPTGWAGYFNGNIYLNGTITLSSDRRMKKDIEPLDTGGALDEIAALRPVAFTWKKTGAPDMGLIAQEVDPVFPQLVTHSGADKTLALKCTSLIAPMIASIQELKKRDDDLEIENAALRRDFDAYKSAHP